jgi:hypothetical protein
MLRQWLLALQPAAPSSSAANAMSRPAAKARDSPNGYTNPSNPFLFCSLGQTLRSLYSCVTNAARIGTSGLGGAPLS